MGRIGVHQPDPLHAVNVRESLQQRRQPALAPEVHAIEGGVLTDHDQFFHATPDQRTRFIQDILRQTADMLPPHERDGTERTGVIASFGDLQIRCVRRGRQETLAEEFGPQMSTQFLQDVPELVGAEEAVHLRDLLFEIHPVPSRSDIP